MVELACTVQGSGDPVVLLHAFPLSSAMWHLPGALLADRWQVLTPDLRGFGASAPGPTEDPPSLDTMADDVAALLLRLGVDRAVVGGLSMGGYVVMALLRRHPHLVRAALLLDTKAGPDTADARARRLAMAAELERTGSHAPLHAMLDSLLGATTRARSPATVAQVRSWIEDADPVAAAWAQRAMAGRPDSAPTLAAADVPVAVVVGEEDVPTPHAEAQAIAAATGTRSTVVWVVPEAGHLSAVEQPERTAGAVADALRHLSAASGR